MVPLYQTTLRYSWQHSDFPHLLLQSEFTGVPNNITWNCILTQMPVNKLFSMVRQFLFFIQQLVPWATQLICMKTLHVRYSCLHVSLTSTYWRYRQCTATVTTAPQYLNPGTRQINAFLPGPDAWPWLQLSRRNPTSFVYGVCEINSKI